jgi:hypothetical protein
MNFGVYNDVAIKVWFSVSDVSPAEGVPDGNEVAGWNGAKAEGRT